MSEEKAKTGISQRKQTRYAVSDDCRVRTTLLIRSSEPGAEVKDWPGTLVDVSPAGAHVQISMAAVAYKGDSCTLKLSHGGVKIELRATLAHYVCSARYSMCGLRFDHSVNQGYEPFLKAIIASSTLKGGTTDSDMPGHYKEEYRGPGHPKLVVWRDNKPERAVAGFDYTMARYAAILTGAGPDMFKNKQEVRFKAVSEQGASSERPLSVAQVAEARWEFSLAASNLPKAIPPDVRKFLRLVS
jgi:hypothetical protein